MPSVDRLFAAVAVVTLCAGPLDAAPTVLVNQAGYRPDVAKLGLVLTEGSPRLTRARVVSVETGRPVFVPDIRNIGVDLDTGRGIAEVDFTKLDRSGRYHLIVDGERSAAFDIGDDVYRAPFDLLMRSYYLQRCGVPLDDSVSGLVHDACHEADGRIRRADDTHDTDTDIAAAGGWHDAGDYGKYVATTTVSIARLLSLYMMEPERFGGDALDIPESGNGTPDILDETTVALEWLLTMQRADGAVYRKLSGLRWPDVVPPDRDDQPRYVFGVSTSDTAKFAATMALAARVFGAVDTDRARTYLRAAELAWSYLDAVPEQAVDWDEGDDKGSGKYLASETDAEESLTHDVDDRFWAATELYLMTGRPDTRAYVVEHIRSMSYTMVEWKDPSGLALWHLVLYADPFGDRSLVRQARNKLLARANLVLSALERHPFRLANTRFIWGSNKMAAEEGLTLAQAYVLTGNPGYLRGAVDQVDYLLGRNPFGMSFVTGFGERTVARVDHIFARAIGRDIPGLLVGGPNSDAQCGLAPKGKGILSYIDHPKSYATNEYAIDYNASLIALLGLLDSVDR